MAISILRNAFSGSDMPDHAQSRTRVCSICWNRSGKKVDLVVEVGSKHETALKSCVDSNYSAADPKQPCGLCFDCKFRLSDRIQGKINPRPLRITTGVKLGKVSQESCGCHMCWLQGSLFRFLCKLCVHSPHTKFVLKAFWILNE